MLAAALAVEDEADDHVGTDRADHPHVVAEDLLLAPLLERLFDAERVAEVDRAREVLLGAVERCAPSSSSVRSTASASNSSGPISFCPPSPRVAVTSDVRKPLPCAVVRQHRVVLVVGMRRRHHQVADGVELAQHQLERRLAAQGGDRLQPVLRIRALT